MGRLEENGPCFVTPDSNSTVLNPWRWNNEVNMLYIDQPTQVGFSFDTLTNVTTYGTPVLDKTTYDTLLSTPLSHGPLLSHFPCESIFATYEAPIANALSSSGRAYYDIAHSTFDPFPPPHLYGYLTNSHVLSTLGSPVNYTGVSNAVNTAFERTFDWYRGGYLEDIAYLLGRNVSVHLIYGDRDTACN
ncbi:Alpha/Beta hydrolase protein [Immersiella caudata]|uniref:Alpha/Beta hydrolase protein n=1 Tax=Immersiella caudata TaxID=314043 RepID=A0AA39WL85_9PEZI|nr:Alpha/Beta hydrolase protein [Immersiella caudata]